MECLLAGRPCCFTSMVFENGAVRYDEEDRIVDLLAFLCLISKQPSRAVSRRCLVHFHKDRPLVICIIFSFARFEVVADSVNGPTTESVMSLASEEMHVTVEVDVEERGWYV